MESIDAVTSTLETFRDIRSPLSISTPRTKEVFTSYILKIEHTRLHIDQLIPKTGNALLQPGQPLDIHITHKGIAYLFRSNHIIQSVDRSNLPFHEISLPTQVQYLEKRSSYRIHLKWTESPTVRVFTSEDNSCQALLENISNTGACIRLQDSHTPLEINGFIDCEILLKNMEPLRCKAIIRRLQHLPKAKEIKVGVEFWQLPTAATRKLHKVLMKLQRRNIRTDLTI
ncbi:MAG: PilZ domain-containing protein [Porticoccus sp.]